MKKFISKACILSLLTVTALASCGKKEEEPTETRTEEQIIVDNGAEALKLLSPIFESLSSTGLSYGGSQELFTSVTINTSHVYTISYQLTAMQTYPREFLTLADSTASADKGKKLVVDAPTSDELAGDEFAKYNLQYTVVFKGYAQGAVAPKGVSYTDKYLGKEICKDKSTKVKVLPISTLTIAKAKSAAAKSVICTHGYVSGFFNPCKEQAYAGMFIQDGDVGMMLYAGKITDILYPEGATESTIKIGDLVEVVGTVSPYNGLYEVKPTIIKKLDKKEGVQPATPRVFETVEELLKKEGKDLDAAEILYRSGTLMQLNEELVITSDLSNLKLGETWSLTAENAKKEKVSIAINYHMNSGKGSTTEEQCAEQKAILDKLTDNLGKSFTFTGFVSANNGLQLTAGISPLTSTPADCFSFGSK